MHKLVWISGIVAIVLMTVSGCGNNAQVAGGSSSSGTQVVHVETDNFTWKLDKTTVSVGRPIEFDITAKEGMHGFSIDGTAVNEQIAAGSPKTVTWTPDRAGTYTIRCNLMCGSGHANMFTTFTAQ